MEQLTTAALTQLPQVRALGRHTGRDTFPLTFILHMLSHRHRTGIYRQ